MTEEQGMMTVIMLMGRSAEMLIKVSGALAKGGVKTAAFLKALLSRLNSSGKVKLLKLINEGKELGCLVLRKEDYERFRDEIAKQHGIEYVPIENKKTGAWLVTMKTEDIMRLRTIMEFLGTKVETPENLNDQQEIKQNDGTLDGSTAISVSEGEPLENEMGENGLFAYEVKKEHFAEMVEANKENSREAELVAEKHWPNLSVREDLRLTLLSEEEYETFKEKAMGMKTPFAAVATAMGIAVAYAGIDQDSILEARGASDMEYRKLVDEKTIESRRTAGKKEQAETEETPENLNDRKEVKQNDKTPEGSAAIPLPEGEQERLTPEQEKRFDAWLQKAGYADFEKELERMKADGHDVDFLKDAPPPQNTAYCIPMSDEAIEELRNEIEKDIKKEKELPRQKSNAGKRLMELKQESMGEAATAAVVKGVRKK